MASLRRSIRRLSARRQVHILGRGASLLSATRFAQTGWGPAGVTFVLMGVAALCGDMIVASWRELPTRLGALELLSLSTLSAAVVAAWGQLQQRAMNSAPEQGRLAAAVEHEIHVAGERRAQVERIEVVASRGFRVDADGARTWLLLDCDHDGYVVVAVADRERELPPIRRRWAIERLRWTHAIVSITSQGQSLEVAPLSVPTETLQDLSACEVLTRAELPIAVQGALPAIASAYRG